MRNFKKYKNRQNGESAKNGGFWLKNYDFRPILTQKFVKTGGFLRVCGWFWLFCPFVPCWMGLNSASFAKNKKYPCVKFTIYDRIIFSSRDSCCRSVRTP